MPSKAPHLVGNEERRYIIEIKPFSTTAKPMQNTMHASTNTYCILTLTTIITITNNKLK